MDTMQSTSNYQRATVVISGDMLEDWRYVFRELKTRVGVSVVSSFANPTVHLNFRSVSILMIFHINT